ncbi:MAG: MOSC domain-containing protein [Nevskia sp.]|jgi:MOSC domain-containing protein YiiM|nr:MOSC domain-containing protein [Nevskia sp.]
MKIPVSGVYLGSAKPMPGDGRPTAIFKSPGSRPVDIGFEGLVGDVQADRRVHGGPEKAVHHFPVENYARLVAQFPEVASGFVPGGLGENISTAGVDETTVCIGDIFALGSARVQLCQPRTPCWKIDARHSHEGITRFVADNGIAGWYYRVLEPGTVTVGDEFALLERATAVVTVAEFWAIVRAHRPALAQLQSVAAIPGLSTAWQRKLSERVEWLRAN